MECLPWRDRENAAGMYFLFSFRMEGRREEIPADREMMRHNLCRTHGGNSYVPLSFTILFRWPPLQSF